jgi:hypothetical protein
MNTMCAIPPGVAFLLQVIPGIPPGSHHIFPHITEKSQHHINDDRGTHCEHGGIHKVLPDPAGGDTKSVANGCANPEGVPFNKVLESVHNPKLEKLNNCPKRELLRQVIFVLLRQL